MVLLPSTLGRAGPLCSEILDLQVAEHGPDARVVTVEGEIDALTAPELAALGDCAAGVLLNGQLSPERARTARPVQRRRHRASGFEQLTLVARESKYGVTGAPMRRSVHA